MSLYLRVRAAPIVALSFIVTVAGVISPIAVLPITAGPLGATVALGLILGLIVPVTVAWACSRGDPELHTVAVRDIDALDLLFALVALGATASAAAVAELAGASEIGLLASRATLTFGGILLVERWRRGWETAAIPPTLYLLAVAVAGRGEDLAHPAVWAWIAADGQDVTAWAATVLVIGLGLVLAARGSLRGR